ncbi:MAG: ferredoxin [Actinobacteria bacterium]|nr:ferredoxin [Actinomycetota bacterium]
MRLQVDWTRCDGHGLCRVLLPEQVEADEWGFPVLRHPDIPERDARRAAAACPALALYVEDPR